MRDDIPHSPMQDAIRAHMDKLTRSEGSIAVEHQMVRDLCVELESIADRLPHLPRPGEVAAIAASLRAGVPAHCRHEEAEFRYYMARRKNPPRELVVAVERLASEHSDNEPLGHELADALEAALFSGPDTNTNALGYLIRLYFETMRRHLMWEEFVIKCLLRDDADQFS